MKAKSLAIGLTTLAIAAAAPASTVYAGYAPSARPTFTCATPTDCTGANYVTFNSFTNAPNYGDERAFFDLKDGAISGSGGYADSMKNLKNGQKVTLRVYVHNNANPAAIGKEAAKAKNTKVQVILPTSKKTTNQAATNISADNANPGMISDTIDLGADSPFTIVFDKNSPVNATYRQNGEGDFVTRTLPGANFISDTTMNASLGDMDGCFNYATIITMTAVVKMDETPPVVPPTTPPTTPPATPTTPTTPGKLPETGAGETAAIAAVVATVAGALGYHRFMSRRLVK